MAVLIWMLAKEPGYEQSKRPVGQVTNTDRTVIGLITQQYGIDSFSIQRCGGGVYFVKTNILDDNGHYYSSAGKLIFMERTVKDFWPTIKQMFSWGSLRAWWYDHTVTCTVDLIPQL